MGKMRNKRDTKSNKLAEPSHGSAFNSPASPKLLIMVQVPVQLPCQLLGQKTYASTSYRTSCAALLGASHCLSILPLLELHLIHNTYSELHRSYGRLLCSTAILRTVLRRLRAASARQLSLMAKDGGQAPAQLLLNEDLLDSFQGVHAVHHVIPCAHIYRSLSFLFFTDHLARAFKSVKAFYRKVATRCKLCHAFRQSRTLIKTMAV